jgi:hypothetical protein
MLRVDRGVLLSVSQIRAVLSFITSWGGLPDLSAAIAVALSSGSSSPPVPTVPTPVKGKKRGRKKGAASAQDHLAASRGDCSHWCAIDIRCPRWTSPSVTFTKLNAVCLTCCAYPVPHVLVVSQGRVLVLVAPLLNGFVEHVAVGGQMSFFLLLEPEQLSPLLTFCTPTYWSQLSGSIMLCILEASLRPLNRQTSPRTFSTPCTQSIFLPSSWSLFFFRVCVTHANRSELICCSRRSSRGRYDVRCCRTLCRALARGRDKSRGTVGRSGRR